MTRNKHFWAIVAGFMMVTALLTPWDESDQSPNFRIWVGNACKKTKTSERARRSSPRDNCQLDDVSDETMWRYSTESWSDTECGGSGCSNSFDAHRNNVSSHHELSVSRGIVCRWTPTLVCCVTENALPWNQHRKFELVASAPETVVTTVTLLEFVNLCSPLCPVGKLPTIDRLVPLSDRAA